MADSSASSEKVDCRGFPTREQQKAVQLVWCFAIDTPYWPLIWHNLFLALGFTPSFPRRQESKLSVFRDTQLNWIPACAGMTVLL